MKDEEDKRRNNETQKLRSERLLETLEWEEESKCQRLADPQCLALLDVMDWMFVSLLNSDSESITFNMVLGKRVFREVTES